jgi:hypothetical protein
VATDPLSVHVTTPPVPVHGWRKTLPIHPAADLFPLLPPDELLELGEDIAKNGLREAPSVWLDPESGDPYLIDGRNRLDAMEALGLQFLHFTPLPARFEVRLPAAGQHAYIGLDTDPGHDPAVIVIAANIHRRHLTPAERANLALQAIEAAGSFVGHPAKLGRPQGLAAKVAKVAGVSKDTAAEQIAVLRDNELKIALAERRLTAAEAGKVVRIRMKAEARQREKEERDAKFADIRAATDLRLANLEKRFINAATERCQRDPDVLPDLLLKLYRATVRNGFENLFDNLIAAWAAEPTA